MSDARDAARRERERQHADRLRRRLVRIFDADGDGLSDSTLPMFGLRTAGRQGPPPSPISLPVGETVTVESVARDGDDLVWTKHPGPVAAGRPQTFPTTALVTRTGGYYVLHLEKLDLVSLGGATVTVTTSSGLVRVAAAPSFGRHLRGCEVPLGVLPRGTTVTVACDQPIVLAVATLEHKDIGALVVADPVEDVPQDELLAWYRADDLDLADGAGVTFWVDRTGNGYDLNTPSASPPLFRPAGLNSLPSVEFDTGRSIHRLTGGLFDFSPRWTVSAIYLVFSLDSSSGTSTILGTPSTSGSGNWFHIEAHRNTAFSGSLFRQGTGFTEPDVWTSGVQQGSAQMTSGTDGELWRDGTLAASGGGMGGRAVSRFRFGHSTSAPFIGKLSEAIFYGVLDVGGATPTLHGTATRQAVETVLADRWGL